MAGIPIESSSLVFTTRQYYLSGSTDSSKGSTLTFQELDNTLIFLSNSIAVNTGSSGVYSSSFSGSGVTTVDKVGGIGSGTSVNDLEGKTFSALFDDIFFPTINPTNNPGSLVSTTSRTYEEVGDIINVIVDSDFTQGTWTVVGQSSRDYYGAATAYFYSSPEDPEISNNLNTSYTFDSYTVTLGTNNFPTAVSHSAGDQPVNSKGNNYENPIPAGKLTDSPVSFQGIYPWFYGSSSAATFNMSDVVTAIQSLYGGSPSTSTKKSITPSTGDITGYFYNTSGAWCWFAHPASSTTKTTMFQNTNNTNTIGPAGTFNNNGTTTITATGYWNNVSYKIYITNARTQFDGTPNQYQVQLKNPS
jgi:hypothetical protein